MALADRDPATDLAQAFDDVTAGHPVDFAAMRACQKHMVDQLDATAREAETLGLPAADAPRMMATLARGMFPFIDALEAGDVDRARSLYLDVLRSTILPLS